MTTASLPILFIHSAKTLRVLYGLLRQTDYVNMMGGASQSMKWNLQKVKEKKVELYVMYLKISATDYGSSHTKE